jgi:hypothetical protein
MRKGRASATATKSDHATIKIVAWMVACAPIVPAALVNLEATTHGSMGWTMAAVGSVIFAAVFIEAAFIFLANRRWLGGAIFLVAGLACFTGNLQNAIINAAATSDHRSDHRKGMVADAEKLRSQRSQWSQDRATVAEIAGATPPATIEADIQQLISSDAGRWRATEECNPLKTTAGASKEFCASVAKLRAKKAAAEKRDELDAKIAQLDERTDGKQVISSVDPYADTIVDLAGAFGYDLKGKADLIGRSPVMVKTLVLEVIATFGPAAVLGIFAFIFGWHRTEKAAAEPEQPAKPKIAAVPPPAPKVVDVSAPVAQPLAVPNGDPMHAFIHECLEDAPGAHMPAGEPWTLWLDWCRKKGIDAGTQRAFGLRLKEIVAWEKNNNRPRYMNVRAKGAAPAIRLAVSNG